MKQPHLLMLGQYPLNKLDSAPKVRTWSLREALKRQANLTFITGTRESRRGPLWHLIRQGHFERFQAVYVEAATSTSMEADLLLLSLLKKAGIPIGIYIRDAYPLFGLSPTKSIKEKLLYQSWHFSQWSYRQLADVLFFPTRSLADCFEFPRKALLPPGTRPALLPKSGLSAGPFNKLLFTGHLNADNGWPLLSAAMDRVYTQMPQIRLLALTPTQLEQTPAWLELRRGVLTDLEPEFSHIGAAIIPRPVTSYNNLALPVKLMDYISLGLPIISTPCHETALMLNQNSIGQIADDDPDIFAQSLLSLLRNPSERQRLAEQAHIAALHNSWEQRAKHLLNILMP